MYNAEITNNGQFLIERETLERWKSVIKRFMEVQDEMEELYGTWEEEAIAKLRRLHKRGK